jgi:NosR/NirI family nitrous oxide reductase transcriptional regulator
MVVSFLLLGVYMRAQPSVTQILTLAGSVAGEWRWDLCLSEPLIFLSWIFIAIVSLIWGRGVFCGWVCPYGAMTELLFKVTQKLGLKSYELPDAWHLKLRYLRYGVLFVLIPAFLWDSVLGEKLAEVEPFKSTFLVPAWQRSGGLLAWWLILLVASTFMYRPFCRYLCPLGAGLALFGSFRASGPRRRQFCSSCTICTRGCEPRAFRPDGTIDPRECLSCMECEATYRNEAVCPPLIGLAKLETLQVLSPAQQRKRSKLQLDLKDV